MSTFLVSLGVIAATIAVVLRVALSGPDQPATLRRQSPRARPPRSPKPARAPGGRRPAYRAAPVAGHAAPPTPLTIPGTPAFALPDSDTMRLRVLPAKPTTAWVRIRSGVALMVLVAVLGALLAMIVGGALVGIAFLIRSATG